MLHIRWQPFNFTSGGKHFFFHIHQFNKPLAGRNKFQRQVALFIKLNRVDDFFRLADEKALFLQHFSNFFLGDMCRQADNLVEILLGFFFVQGIEDAFAVCDVHNFAVQTDDLFNRQAGFFPPCHVSGIAKGADHHNTCSFVFFGVFGRHNRYRNIKQGDDGGFAEQVFVALIVRVGDDSQTRGQQFGAGGCNGKCFIAVFDAETDIMEPALHFLIFNLGLRNGGFERYIPHNRRFNGDDFALLV